MAVGILGQVRRIYSYRVVKSGITSFNVRQDLNIEKAALSLMRINNNEPGRPDAAIMACLENAGYNSGVIDIAKLDLDTLNKQVKTRRGDSNALAAVIGRLGKPEENLVIEPIDFMYSWDDSSLEGLWRSAFERSVAFYLHEYEAFAEGPTTGFLEEQNRKIEVLKRETAARINHYQSYPHAKITWTNRSRENLLEAWQIIIDTPNDGLIERLRKEMGYIFGRFIIEARRGSARIIKDGLQERTKHYIEVLAIIYRLVTDEIRSELLKELDAADRQKMADAYKRIYYQS